MKTGTDTYIQWKQEHYDQDAIKSYCSQTCHLLARKIPRLTSSPLSYRIPSFLGIFVKVNPPFREEGFDLWMVSTKWTNHKEQGFASNYFSFLKRQNKPSQSVQNKTL